LTITSSCGPNGSTEVHGKNFVADILRQGSEKEDPVDRDDQTGSPTWTVDLAKRSLRSSAGGANGDLPRRQRVPAHGMPWKRDSSPGRSGGDRVVPITSAALDRPAPRPAYSVSTPRNFARETGRAMRPWAEALREYLGERC